MEKLLLHHSVDDGPSSSNPEAAEIHPNQLDIDGAVREMHAVIPQYKATISGLQSRLAVLTKQLEAATNQRDEFRADATAWQQKAHSLEASYVITATKLHAQEAAALQSTSAAQNKIESLEAALATWKARCLEAEAALHDARSKALKVQKHAESQAKLVATQTQTIDRLQATVREQQDDILSALSLVCNRSPPLPKKSNRPLEENKALIYQSWDASKDEIKDINASWKIPAISKSPMKRANNASMPGDSGLDILEPSAGCQRRYVEAENFQKDKPSNLQKHDVGDVVASEIASLHAALRKVI
jgi:hypothetical protein